jgi:DNA-directed RNA polymerase specialized sigma24 family protein
MVSDHLWYKANEVVDERRVFKKPVRGAGHPLRGTTRQRRGLLAGVFVCGCCGSPMHSFGKQDGHFRCSAAVSGDCWYRGYCMRERAYPAVLEAVVNEVLSLDGVRNAVLARVKELHEQGGSVAAELKRLDKDEKKLVSAIERLSAAVESGDGSLASLTSRLADRERELAIVRSRRREVEEQASRKKKLPSAAKLLEHLEAVKGQLLGEENRTAVILRQLLDGPQLVKHARVTVERRLEGKTYKEIAKELDLTEYNVENCAAITRLMEAAGLPEPYRRLTEKPDHVPQWCSKHWLQAGERKGGGRRRRAS